MQADTPEPINFVCGFPEESEAFKVRNELFLRRWSNLEKAFEIGFNRVHSNTSLSQRLIYFIGRVGLEEFFEIVLLCGNGYGIGAQKLLRAMYERAVTARYLHKHPEKAEDYLEFHRVADYKILKSAQLTLGPALFSEEQAAQITGDFEAVKSKFLITDCDECKTTRLNHTWSKVDLVSMAREVGGLLWTLLLPAYHLPTREFHSTMGAVFSRLDATAAGKGEGIIFDGSAQIERADQALSWAHAIILNILELQKSAFN